MHNGRPRPLVFLRRQLQAEDRVLRAAVPRRGEDKTGVLGGTVFAKADLINTANAALATIAAITYTFTLQTHTTSTSVNCCCIAKSV